MTLPPFLVENDEEMIKTADVREHVIKPALRALAAYDPRMYSEAAVSLMLGTAAAESKLGFNLVQEGNGPALGIFQMEPATHDDVWRYLDRPDKAELRKIVNSLTVKAHESELVHNLIYATAMARIRYWYVSDPLPVTRSGQAHYYKKHYNTPQGKGSPEKYLRDYEKYIGE